MQSVRPSPPSPDDRNVHFSAQEVDAARSAEDRALLETYEKQMNFIDLSALVPIAREILRG